MIILLFLENRRFKVKVDGEYSDEVIQLERAPQGSVFSTTLFILAINGLAYQLYNARINRFSDGFFRSTS